MIKLLLPLPAQSQFDELSHGACNMHVLQNMLMASKAYLLITFVLHLEAEVQLALANLAAEVEVIILSTHSPHL